MSIILRLRSAKMKRAGHVGCDDSLSVDIYHHHHFLPPHCMSHHHTRQTVVIGTLPP